MEFAHLALEAVDAGGQHGEFLVELVKQFLQFVGLFGDAIEAGVQDGSRFKAGHRLGAFELAIGIAGHAAVLLHQVAQGLIGPVGGLHIGKLVDAGHLVAGSPRFEGVNVLLLHVVVNGSTAVKRSDFLGRCG